MTIELSHEDINTSHVLEQARAALKVADDTLRETNLPRFPKYIAKPKIALEMFSATRDIVQDLTGLTRYAEELFKYASNKNLQSQTNIQNPRLVTLRHASKSASERRKIKGQSSPNKIRFSGKESDPHATEPLPNIETQKILYTSAPESNMPTAPSLGTLSSNPAFSHEAVSKFTDALDHIDPVYAKESHDVYIPKINSKSRKDIAKETLFEWQSNRTMSFEAPENILERF